MTGLHQAAIRTAGVLRLELLYILRDRTTRSLLVAVPAIQLALFGYAVNLDPHGVALAVAGDAGGAARIAGMVADSSYFRVVADGLPPGGAAAAVAAGRAAIGIEVPAPDPEADVQPSPRVIVDAADPAAVRPALAQLERAFLNRVIDQRLLGGPPQVTVEWLYNPDGRTAWSIIPGLAGVVVMISMLMLGALSLVREREGGTWESLAATPVTALETLAGKMAPYLVLGVAQSALVVAMAHVLFALPVRGSLLPLLAVALLAAACHLLVGLAVSAVTRTQMQAMQAAVFLYLPSMLLSGFMFPFDGMPRWARTIGECLPLTHFVRAARDGLLRGADSRAWHEVGSLAAITAACGAVSLTLYARQRR